MLLNASPLNKVALNAEVGADPFYFGGGTVITFKQNVVSITSSINGIVLHQNVGVLSVVGDDIIFNQNVVLHSVSTIGNNIQFGQNVVNVKAVANDILYRQRVET